MTSNPALPNPLSRHLRDLIKKSGWSAQEVSRRTQVGNYFIYDVISGKNSNPSAVKLARIAKVLGIPLDELMNPPVKKESNVRHMKQENVEVPIFKPFDIFIKLNKGDRLRPFDDVLQDILINALRFCNGNKTKAADELGMSRPRFYRRVGAHRELLSNYTAKSSRGSKRNNFKMWGGFTLKNRASG